jgi:hypothetical protein
LKDNKKLFKFVESAPGWMDGWMDGWMNGLMRILFKGLLTAINYCKNRAKISVSK